MLGLRLSCLLGVFENSDIWGPKVFVIPQSTTCLGSGVIWPTRLNSYLLERAQERRTILLAKCGQIWASLHRL